MASFIYLGALFPNQYPCHESGFYNLKDDIRVCSRNDDNTFDEHLYQAIIAKGNIIQGVEAIY